MSKERLHWVDAARGVMMLLGLAIHTAELYRVGPSVLYTDNMERSYVMNALAEFIHVFRMPAFFLVGGFFVNLSLTRTSSSEFIFQRFVRLIVPALATSTFVMAPVILYIPYPLHRLSVFSTHHLWFLYDLYVLTFVAVVASSHGSNFVAALDRMVAYISRNSVVFMLLLSSVYSVFSRIIISAANIDLMVTSTNSLLFGAPYFFVGMYVQRRREVLLSLTQIPTRWCAIIILLGLIPLDDQATALLPRTSELRFLGVAFREPLVVFAILSLFARFANHTNAGWRYLAAASFSIYLLHLPVILVIGYLLLDVDMGVAIEAMIVAAGTAASCLAFYELVVARSRVAALLFGGPATRRISPTSTLPSYSRN